MKIRTRMFLGLMLVVVSFVATANYAIHNLLGEIAEQELVYGLRTSVAAFHRYDQQRQDLLLSQAQSMAQTAHLKATLTIADVDAQTVAGAHRLLKEVADPPLLLILDETGRVFADLNAAATPNEKQTKAQWPGLATALDGEPYYGSWHYGNHLYQVGVAPIVVGERIVGLVVIGHRLDDLGARELASAITGTNIALTLQGEILSATQPGERHATAADVRSLLKATPRILATVEDVDVVKVFVDDMTYAMAVLPHADVNGTWVMYRSDEFIQSTFDPLRWILFALSAAAILLGALFSSRMSTRISLPIMALTDTAREYSQGKFDTKVTQQTNDELGELAQAFNSMGDDIVRQQTELVHSKEAAEAASRAKSDFLATMSHEIRTPMNGVLGMTELLLSSGVDKRQKHLAASAYRSAEGLLSVINDILDFSKIEADKFELDLKDFDLVELCEDALEMVAESTQRKGLELIADLAQETPPLTGDDTRIRQVLVNLLSNATKFTDTGEIRLTQKSVQRDDKTVDVMFEVTDTGIGIENDKLTRIFDAFTQVDGTTSRTYGGTGLGLAISRRLVLMMGGELDVVSTVGAGTSFRFSLPLTKAAQPTQPTAEPEALKGVRSLVVDDHQTNREILQSQLMGWGMRTDSASSGAEALRALEASATEGDPYRIALLDLQMPEMDGLQLAGSINANPRIPDLPMIIMSSTFAAAGGALSSSIISQYLTKPVRHRELLNGIRSALGDQSHDLNEAQQIKPRLVGRVLLAEDNEINQEIAAATLEVAGCEVVIASDGIEAVKAALEQHFDLILMDCHMPEMDGFDATRAIRSLAEPGEDDRMPIIALTADVRKGIDEECRLAGMDDYLSKPFSQESLTAVLERWLPHSEAPATHEQTQLDIQSLQLLDRAAIEQLLRLSQQRGKNLLKRSIDLFGEAFPEQLSIARESFAAGELERCADAVHSLKSASGNIGATALVQHCAEIEAQTRSGVATNLATMLENLALAYQTVQPELAMAANLPFQTLTELPVATKPTQNVLVVDDDAAIRLVISETLLAAGYGVDQCTDGREVLRVAKRKPPDLILLDAVMPGMDGFETCQRLREDPELSNIPVIMVTGLEDIGSITRAFSCGATAFAQKPINSALLLEDVRFVLRSSVLADQLRSSQARLETAQRLSRIGYWEWIANQGLFKCSEELEAILGYAAGSIGNDRQRFLQSVHPEDRAKVGDALEATALLGEGAALEYRVLRLDGHELLMRQETEVRNDAAGQCTVFGAVQDISMQRAVEDKIRKLAYYDPLTSLASRSYFMQRMDEIIKSAKRRSEGFTLFFMDLDGFKDVNDSMGHDVGDRLLEEIARRLRLVFRETDFIARLGGDEFCVLMERVTDSYDLEQVAERCLAAIEEPVDLNVRQIRPRISIGIARYPEDGDTAQMVIKSADSAMYSAKQNGKHRFEYYNAELTTQAEKRLSLVGELREAFHKDEFFLHYQPLVDLKTGRINGVEALVRWQHPYRGMVPPVEFISALERMGLINQLGERVLHNACVQALNWASHGDPLKVSVNISPGHFLEPDFVDKTRAIITNTGIAPDRVLLEVTESAIQDGAQALANFSKLRDLGVGLAIDDFGTGYSSLGSLHNIPIDVLKIDRVFIQDLLTNPRDSIMLGTIVGMAHALNLQVVAEGVEELGHVQTLSSLGCDTAQGYFFSKPLAPIDLESLLDSVFIAQDKVSLARHSTGTQQ